MNNYQDNESYRIAKEELIRRLLASKLIKDWLKQYKQTPDFVTANSQMFSRYLNDFSKCENCLGLDSCTLSVKGNLETPQLNSGLNLRLLPCRYNNLDKLANRDYQLNPDIAEQWLTKDYEALLTDLKDKKTPNNGNLKQVVLKLDKQLDFDDFRGVYLYGGLGVGKTHLMACIANYYAKNKQTVGFYNVSDLSNLAKTLISEPYKLDKLREDMTYCRVLILDDIGASRVSEWIRDDWFYTILNSRLENQKKTFLTSNLDYKHLKDYFMVKADDELKVVRLMERIEALTIPLELEGANWRRKDS